MEESDATERTASSLVASERIEDVSAGRLRARRVCRARLEQRPRLRELGVHVAGREQSEVAHLDEARGQDVEQEPVKEYGRR